MRNSTEASVVLLNIFITIRSLCFLAKPNTSNAEATSGTYVLDLVSNCFKFRGNGDGVNGSGQSFIYMAFAEAPLVGTNGVTAKAR